MYKKHLEQLAIVSLKVFFNFDNDINDHVIIVAKLGIAHFKLLYSECLYNVTAALFRLKVATAALKESLNKRESVQTF